MRFSDQLLIIISYGIKFVSANFVASVLASFLLLPFIGAHSFRVPAEGATIWKREANFFYNQAFEGFFCGRMDQNGYNNQQLTINNQQNIDVLLIGSSHFEALQVPQNANIGSLLTEKLQGAPMSGITYSLGTSATLFPHIVSHYENAIRMYSPKRYVVVEYIPNEIDEVLLKKALDGALDKQDFNKERRTVAEVLFANYRIFCHLALRFRERRPYRPKNTEIKLQKTDNFYSEIRRSFQIIAQSSKQHDVQCLLLFRPSLILNEDGTLHSSQTEEYRRRIREISESEGLIFVDMTDHMISEYNEKKVLPYGFWNTIPNAGHCNKEGHRMMAEAIYDRIMELESAKGEEKTK